MGVLALSTRSSIHSPPPPLHVPRPLAGFDYSGGAWKLFKGEAGKTYNLYLDGTQVGSCALQGLFPQSSNKDWPLAKRSVLHATAYHIGGLNVACLPMLPLAVQAGCHVWRGRHGWQGHLHPRHHLHARARGGFLALRLVQRGGMHCCAVLRGCVADVPAPCALQSLCVCGVLRGPGPLVADGCYRGRSPAQVAATAFLTKVGAKWVLDVKANGNKVGVYQSVKIGGDVLVEVRRRPAKGDALWLLQGEPATAGTLIPAWPTGTALLLGFAGEERGAGWRGHLHSFPAHPRCAACTIQAGACEPRGAWKERQASCLPAGRFSPACPLFLPAAQGSAVWRVAGRVPHAAAAADAARHRPAG